MKHVVTFVLMMVGFSITSCSQRKEVSSVESALDHPSEGKSPKGDLTPAYLETDKVTEPKTTPKTTEDLTGEHSEDLKEDPTHVSVQSIGRHNAVYVSLKESATGTPINGIACTGFIITNRLIVTAAHCFEPIRQGPGQPQILVEPDTIIFGDPSNPAASSINVNEFRQPEEFAAGSMFHDIAWIKVPSIPANSNALPIYNHDGSLPEGRKVYYYGLSGKQPRFGMAKIGMPDRKVLTDDGFGILEDFITKIISLNNDYGIRSGDSGSPLYIKKNGQWNVAGVLIERSQIGRSDQRVVNQYLAITPHLEWIKTSSGENLP